MPPIACRVSGYWRTDAVVQVVDDAGDTLEHDDPVDCYELAFLVGDDPDAPDATYCRVVTLPVGADADALRAAARVELDAVEAIIAADAEPPAPAPDAEPVMVAAVPVGDTLEL